MMVALLAVMLARLSSTALRLSADIRKDGRQAAIFCNFVCIVV